jgi:hypothetical protein
VIRQLATAQRVRDLKVVKWLVSFFVANIRAYVVR